MLAENDPPLTLGRFLELQALEAPTPEELAALQSATRLLYGRLGELLAELPREETRELAEALDRLEHVDT